MRKSAVRAENPAAIKTITIKFNLQSINSKLRKAAAVPVNGNRRCFIFELTAWSNLECQMLSSYFDSSPPSRPQLHFLADDM